MPIVEHIARGIRGAFARVRRATFPTATVGAKMNDVPEKALSVCCILYVDNKSAIDVAYNPQHHGRMKHVDRRHFYVRELVENHTLRVPFVSSARNLADLFTKPLAGPTFFPLRDKVMNVPEHLREASARVVATGGR